jgi:hypothetical protein
MTELNLTEAAPERAMNDYEHQVADDVKAALQAYSGESERSLQSRAFKVGISDLGWCSERTRRMLAKMTPDHEDYTKAFIGTALGDHLERACSIWWPDAIIQPEVEAVLHGDQHDYHVPGHPDLVRPSGIVIDFKSARGLSAPRRTGPSQQQQFQRHVYALACHAKGLFEPHIDLADVVVANVWIDRAGDYTDLYVHAEQYDSEVVQQATWWLDEVSYSFVNNEEARKEPPREMCQAVCGFYKTCRALDTDVEGLLSDDTVLAAVDMYQEGIQLEKRGRQLKDEAKANLSGITGSTGEFTVRWTHVNAGHVEYDRKSYEKLDIRRLK